MSMAGLSPQIHAKYASLTNDDLYSLLGTTTHKPDLGATTSRALTADDALLPLDIKALGERIFQRWSRALHDFACAPTAEDKDQACKILNALSLKDGGATAIVAGALVTAFGLAPATAAIIAALAVRLILKPAGEEICKAWDEQLNQSEA